MWYWQCLFCHKKKKALKGPIEVPEFVFKVFNSFFFWYYGKYFCVSSFLENVTDELTKRKSRKKEESGWEDFNECFVWKKVLNCSVLSIQIHSLDFSIYFSLPKTLLLLFFISPISSNSLPFFCHLSHWEEAFPWDGKLIQLGKVVLVLGAKDRQFQFHREISELGEIFKFKPITFYRINFLFI